MARPTGRSGPHPVPAHPHSGFQHLLAGVCPRHPHALEAQDAARSRSCPHPQTGCTNKGPRPTDQTVSKGQRDGSQQTKGTPGTKAGWPPGTVSPRRAPCCWGLGSKPYRFQRPHSESRRRLTWQPHGSALKSSPSPGTTRGPAHSRRGSCGCGELLPEHPVPWAVSPGDPECPNATRQGDPGLISHACFSQ